MAFSKHGTLKKIEVEKHMIMMIIAIVHGMVYCLLIKTPPHPVPWMWEFPLSPPRGFLNIMALLPGIVLNISHFRYFSHC